MSINDWIRVSETKAREIVNINYDNSELQVTTFVFKDDSGNPIYKGPVDGVKPIIDIKYDNGKKWESLSDEEIDNANYHEDFCRKVFEAATAPLGDDDIPEKVFEGAREELDLMSMNLSEILGKSEKSADSDAEYLVEFWWDKMTPEQRIKTMEDSDIFTKYKNLVKDNIKKMQIGTLDNAYPGMLEALMSVIKEAPEVGESEEPTKPEPELVTK